MDLILRSPGDDLLELASGTEESVVLVAPFVKHGALKRIVYQIPIGVPVVLYTRWRIGEVLLGVSDISVWEILRDRRHSELRLCGELHAKCFVFDQMAVVGSANLTSKALGWSAVSNLELQIFAKLPDARVEGLLAALASHSTVVDEAYFDRFAQLVAQADPPPTVPEISDPGITSSNGVWIPQTRNPSALFSLYSGEQEALSRSALLAAGDDLQRL